MSRQWGDSKNGNWVFLMDPLGQVVSERLGERNMRVAWEVMNWEEFELSHFGEQDFGGKAFFVSVIKQLHECIEYK